MITAAQCKMARAALGWGVRELAAQAKVSASTVNRFETGLSEPNAATLTVIRQALESAGIEFIPGGARLREPADAEL
jgi:transcriptional regulator with XRE-family HTH domain